MAKKKAPEKMNADAVQVSLNAQLEALKSYRELEDPAEVAASCVGLYIPNLCLRYLFQRTTMPFERSYLLFGPSGSNKTSFLYWFYNLVRLAGGRYLHLECEDKDTPDLRLSLTGYDRNAGKSVPCESMDDFQRNVKYYFEQFAKINSSEIGRRVPYVIGIDSLTGKMTEEAYATVAKNDGAAGRRWADEARSLSDWFKVASKYIKSWPFYLVSVAHDKPTKDARTTQLTHKMPGGLAPRYYATYQVLLSRVGKFKPNSEGWEGNRIKFLIDKSSLGADRRTIEAEIAWRDALKPNAKGEDVMSQETVWGWNKATTELLFRMCSAKEKGPADRAVDELVGLTKKGGRYSSSTLGIRGDQALSPVEMGKYIESLPELLQQLEPRIGIHRSVVFDPEIDLLDQLKAARENSPNLIAAPYEVEEGAAAIDDSAVYSPDDSEQEIEN